MSRDMKVAYRRLFRHLEDYCTIRDDSVAVPGAARWAAADSEQAKAVLKRLRVKGSTSFGGHRFLAWTEFDGVHYITLIGFDFEARLKGLLGLDLHSGFSMAVLSEFLPLPIRSTAEVKNIVGAGSVLDADYYGHDPRMIESLFPSIQVLECEQEIDLEAAHRIFLRLCVSECRQGNSWISDELADGLDALTELAIPSLPYSAVCRSVFDADPRSMFMAVYRCIEATYAYESTRKVVDRLGLQHSWFDLAQALEAEVGWHPQESASLNLILSHALDRDLESICECLEVEPGRDVQVSAGRAIYQLRNRIVHFRPGVEDLNSDDIDWNSLCANMVSVVFHTFTKAFVS